MDQEEDPAAPVIVQPPEDIEVMEGQAARFICRAQGYPPPRLHWYKNNEIMAEVTAVWKPLTTYLTFFNSFKK